MGVDRERIRDQLQQGIGPDQIAQGDRATHHAVLEEDAKLSGEFNAFEPTPENVVFLRDTQNLRWEAIAVRTFGAVRRIGDLKALYDELKGEGAHRRSYTGRGRRYPEMNDQALGNQKAPPATVQAPRYGVVREASAPADRLRELDLLRTGSRSEVEQYLERHLHSDRFYIDGDRIWLELPNRMDSSADKALLTWFRVPSGYIVAAPRAGTRAGLHAVPSGTNSTLCRLELSAWTSGIRTYEDGDVTCRWCEIRLVAARLATGRGIPRKTGG